MAKFAQHRKLKRKAIRIVKRLKKKLGKPKFWRIRKNSSFLNKLLAAAGSLKKLKKLFKNATNSELLAIAEIILNLLHSNIPLTVTQKRILCPFRNRLREVASKKTNCSEKRKIFTNQKGGILGIIGTILSIAIPAIKSLFSSSS
jgi:hypothetical protein